MIASAISCDVKLLLADEPTTSLDVTIQAQVLELLSDISKRLDSSVILITHNLGLVSRYAKRAYVMYAGQIVETGPVDKLYQQPLHPYTVALWASILDISRPKKTRILQSDEDGAMSDISNREQGCAYFPHCKDRELECERERPALTAVDDSHYVLCHRATVGGKNVAKQ